MLFTMQFQRNLTKDIDKHCILKLEHLPEPNSISLSANGVASDIFSVQLGTFGGNYITLTIKYIPKRYKHAFFSIFTFFFFFLEIVLLLERHST